MSKLLGVWRIARHDDPTSTVIGGCCPCRGSGDEVTILGRPLAGTAQARCLECEQLCQVDVEESE